MLDNILTATVWSALIFAWALSFATGSKISSNPFVWILYVIGGWLTIFVIWYLRHLVVLIRNKIHEVKVAKEPCPHGVVGGKTRMESVLAKQTPTRGLFAGLYHLKCPHCNQNEIEILRKEQIEKLHRDAAEKIRAAADKLQSDENLRLTKLRTHKIDFLLRLSPGEFEEIVGDMYRKLGYSVERTPMTNDFGRDLILKKDGQTTFVECKRYDRDTTIGRGAL